MPLPLPLTTVLLDIDGTLLDSNAAHTSAWVQALCEHGIETDEAEIRPLIGMGGDKLLPKIAKVSAESPRGRLISDRKKAVFDTLLPHLLPTNGARAFVEFLRQQRLEIVIATSAAEDEVSQLLVRAGVAGLIPKRTSSDDVEESKPDPDIVHAALARARTSAGSAIMIGDTPYDIEAGTRAGVRAVAVRCGGYWSDDDLRGAVTIADDPAALLAAWC